MAFEPGQFPDALPKDIPLVGGAFHVGFEKPPGAEIGSANHMLNDHTYCCQMGAGACDASGNPWKNQTANCEAWHSNKVGTRIADAERLGVPLVLSEFGSCIESEECATEITQVADLADKDTLRVSGWAYWQFKSYHDLTS